MLPTGAKSGSKARAMSGRRNLRTGGQILVDQLKIHGVEMAFCVPGESYLAVLDALYDARDEIRLVVCRQEGGAAYMADAYGKLTGRPGICMVTRGPGAANAAVGLHTAYQDSTPLILFIGQVPRGHAEREAFQEVDFRKMYAPFAKWVAQIEDPGRIPEFVARAFQTATSGRPGPVVLVLPEDMLREPTAASDVARYRPVQAHPAPADMQRLGAMLGEAKRPFMLVGGSGWTAEAVADLTAFAEASRIAVGTSFRAQDHFDNSHPCYIGDVGIGPSPKLVKHIEEADLILAVGCRLGEMTTGGYRLLEPPRIRQTLIHVHAGAEELGSVYQPDLAINSGMPAFAAAARALPPVAKPPWAAWTEAAHADLVHYRKPVACPGELQMAELVAWLDANLPPDTIVANGAGNFSGWVHRFYRFRQFGTQLGPTNGSMGYGVPAAVAASILHPDRLVLSFSGDGCFLMNGQEIATAVQYGAAPIFFVVNNGMYGTIRMHQEREYPNRVSGSDLHNPDFAAYGRAFGLHGETVARTAEFAPAFERARAAGRAALIELRLDPEALTTRASLSQIRAAALAAKGD
jgi:acetolactate synthase-1/2/3 large subunit